MRLGCARLASRQRQVDLSKKSFSEGIFKSHICNGLSLKIHSPQNSLRLGVVLDRSNYLKIFCNYISKESNRLTFFQDLHTAMMILGVNIMEQECIDMTNEVAKNGHIYFPEFCRIVLRKFREDDDEQFAQVMFKVRSLFSK